MKNFNSFDFKAEYARCKTSFVTSKKRRDSGVKYLNVAVAFDTETTSFYESYIEMRKTKLNANQLIEIPTIKKMLPDWANNGTN